MTRHFEAHAKREKRSRTALETSALPMRSAESSQGERLDTRTRAALEPGFGHDFSNVRVHADREADELSSDFGARAFTNSNDLFFRSGEYSPETIGGQHLLAHELAHVVQQERFGGPSRRGLSESHEASEVEANAAADAVLAGRSATVQSHSSAAIAREKDDDELDLSPLNDALNDKSPLKSFRVNPFPQQKPDSFSDPRADSQKDWDKWQAEGRGDKYPSPLTDPQPADPKDPHNDPRYWKDWGKPEAPGTPYLYPNPLAPDLTSPPWIQPDVPWLKNPPQDEPIPGPGDYPDRDEDQRYS